MSSDDHTKKSKCPPPGASGQARGAGADQTLCHGEPGIAGTISLVDELGVKDLRELIFGRRGRLFSAAGRDSPVAEFTGSFLVLHPPQMPFDETYSEQIAVHADERGILLNELGQRRKIAGAKYAGCALWWLAEQAPDGIKHYAGWLDDKGQCHKLYLDGKPLTADTAYRMRNRTHDGELSVFAELTSD